MAAIELWSDAYNQIGYRVQYREKSNTVRCGCVRVRERVCVLRVARLFCDDASMAGTCFARKWNGRLSFTQMIRAEWNSLRIDRLAETDKAKWFSSTLLCASINSRVAPFRQFSLCT